VYDGDCGFCAAFVQAAERRLPVPVTAVPRQRAALAQLGIPPAEAGRAVQWVGQDGSRRAGHLAIAAWLGAAGSGWRLLGLAISNPVAGAAYRLVAANRTRIPWPWPGTCKSSNTVK
jgi:predicted DCC family thiol-disulfide oxidoreductase YuxK